MDGLEKKLSGEAKIRNMMEIVIASKWVLQSVSVAVKDDQRSMPSKLVS